jgi:hypothetical protein
MRSLWADRGQLGEVVKYMASDAAILHYPCYNAEALWVRWKRRNDNCEAAAATPHAHTTTTTTTTT